MEGTRLSSKKHKINKALKNCWITMLQDRG
ncbi:hypothetical protein V6Z11_D10G217900 [Gossypium hirsutum]